MRILHVIQQLGIGGAERTTIALARGARLAGHEVAVAAAPGPLAAALDVPTFAVPILRRRIHRLPVVAGAVRRALRAWSPHVIHCHNPGMALAVALASGWTQRRPALVTIEGVADEDYRMTGHLLRWLGMSAVACGAGVAAALRDHGVGARTIPNGISPPPPPADRSSLDREWHTVRGRRLIVCAGRLVAQKNFALAVRALAEIPDAALVIMGDGPLRAQLEHEAAAAKVGDRVVLAGLRADAREVIGAADAVIITSRSEGLPLVALEALAAGRPIIATRGRWQYGLLAHEHDCLLVEPDDATALAAAVRRVLGEPGLAAGLGRAGLCVAASYTEEAMLKEYLQLYQALSSPE